ncbi:MAG: hypothetical protein NTX03_05635 [Bacteroidetes bacterium]|nr:hypothetical protein [Bacteroidota bacterium]
MIKKTYLIIALILGCLSSKAQKNFVILKKDKAKVVGAVLDVSPVSLLEEGRTVGFWERLFGENYIKLDDKKYEYKEVLFLKTNGNYYYSDGGGTFYKKVKPGFYYNLYKARVSRTVSSGSYSNGTHSTSTIKETIYAINKCDTCDVTIASYWNLKDEFQDDPKVINFMDDWKKTNFKRDLVKGTTGFVGTFAIGFTGYGLLYNAIRPSDASPITPTQFIGPVVVSAICVGGYLYSLFVMDYAEDYLAQTVDMYNKGIHLKKK